MHMRPGLWLRWQLVGGDKLRAIERDLVGQAQALFRHLTT
jgi:hypothetical protein